MQNNLQRC